MGDMRYWGIFVLKLAGIWALVRGIWELFQILMPPPATFLYYQFRPFGRDLTWTVAILLLFLFACGLLYTAIYDQPIAKCFRKDVPSSNISAHLDMAP
jgi:hypothetical protein